jgi:hypothetical protein
MKPLFFIFAFSLLLAAMTACRQVKEPQTGKTALFAAFQPMAAPERIEIDLSPDGEAKPPGDSIANALFFASLDANWLREIEQVADSTESKVYSAGRFALDQGFDACLVDIRRHWFRHVSLLVYDKQQQTFTDRLTVAGWYGGDGSQILTGSWLADIDGDGKKDLIRREIEHALRMQDNGEPLETTTERGGWLRWKEGRFLAAPTTDSSDLIKRFPIRSVW